MIGKKIKERREELGLSQEQLAKLLGISKSAVSNYEVNISSPKETILLKLFEALKCDANYLYEDYLVAEKDFTVNTYEKKHIRKYRTLDEYGKKAIDDLLNTEYERCTYAEDEAEPTLMISHSDIAVSAGAGEFLDEQNIECREYPDTPISRQADIVIPVSGHSMEPKYYDGDEIFVRLQPAVNVGEIGIFIVDGKGYVKEYSKDRLISINPDYDDIYPSDYDDTKCIGKVLGKVDILPPAKRNKIAIVL